MAPDDIEALFARGDGYAFARWGRPIVPVVFGVDDATLATLKGAIEAVAVLAGHPLAETDPELGANLMLFFLRDWAELLEVPNLERMIPDLAATVARLEAAGAHAYRAFRFDGAGAIRAGFVFLRLAGGREAEPADAVALDTAVRAMLDWGPEAFARAAPLARHPETGGAVLRPEIAALIRAAYDPLLPAATRDPSHALRLHARVIVP